MKWVHESRLFSVRPTHYRKRSHPSDNPLPLLPLRSGPGVFERRAAQTPRLLPPLAVPPLRQSRSSIASKYSMTASILSHRQPKRKFLGNHFSPSLPNTLDRRHVHLNIFYRGDHPESNPRYARRTGSVQSIAQTCLGRSSGNPLGPQRYGKYRDSASGQSTSKEVLGLT